MGHEKILIILTMLLLLAPTAAFAKSYSYDLIDTDLTLYPNGSVLVQQHRAYNFIGSFSYAYVDLLKRGVDDITFLEIGDLDAGTSLQFDVEEDASHAKATWHYSASDEVKNFLIAYQIDGAVKRYEDVAELYWKVIEDKHERIDAFYSTVRLPSASPSLFKVFVHGVGEGQLTFSSDLSEAYVSTGSIPADTFLEFRVLAEPDIFPDVQQQSVQMYESILAEERQIFSSSPQYAISFALGSIEAQVLIFAIPLAVLIAFYLKYGREPKVDYDREYEQEPPSDIPPMALANLLEGAEEVGITLEARGMIATLFDLAVRGYLKIEEREKKKFFGLSKSTEQAFILTKKGMEMQGLLNFEKDILNFVMRCGDGREATSTQISDYSKNNRTTVKRDIEGFDNLARDWFETEFFKISDRKSSSMMKLFKIVLIAYGLVVSGVMYFFSSLQIWLVLAYFVIFLLVSRSISRRTYESSLETKRWKAFRRFISDFSQMKDAPIELLYIWDRYLVYAVVLGVADKLLKNMAKIAIEKNVKMHPVVWYVGLHPTPSGVMSPQAFASLSSSIAQTVSALSSSTSIGGGFAGGGAGGGGGGGGSSGAG